MSSEFNILIVGATGVFGSRLARLAALELGVRLTLAGRRIDPLNVLAHDLGCTAQSFDRDRVEGSQLEGFDAVIDCAGPFQGSHTRLIEQCIAARVIYIDLADGRDFVCSIGRFDAAAKGAGIAVTTGASSIPALSHAVLDRLTEGWRRIHAIRIGIFPGNRAPRGRSVVEAILSYVGKPVRLFTDGEWRDLPGWALAGRVDCGGRASAGRACATRPNRSCSSAATGRPGPPNSSPGSSCLSCTSDSGCYLFRSAGDWWARFGRPRARCYGSLSGCARWAATAAR